VIGNHKVLSVIPARGGSKEVPRKNLLDIGGKPLVAWSVEASHAASLVDRTVLSSDDDEIINVARAAGCEVPFRRPDAISGDEARIEDALVHAIEHLDETFDYIVLLHPTSPFRTGEDIDNAIRRCHQSGAPSCNSVMEAHESPYWMYRIADSGRMEPLLDKDIISRRQDLPKIYWLNGGVHVARTDWFLEKRTFFDEHSVAYIMPRERSLDLDNQFDLYTIRGLIAQGIL
jgi:CMP-N,N'-diacetyllegionaminic acid synthase